MNQYEIRETCLKRVCHFPKEEYDKLAIIMIYPNSNYDMNDDKYDLTELLHILFKAKMTAPEKKCQLEKNYGIMMTKKTEREAEGMCNLSQIHVDAGRREGLAKGRKEGRKEGLSEGIIKGQCQIIINMMQKTNLSLHEVMEMLSIDKTLRPQIAKLLNRQEIEEPLLSDK